MRGSNIIIMAVSIVAALSIMTVDGGVISYTIFETETQAQQQVEDITNQIQNTDVDITDPISATLSAYQILSTMLTVAFNIDTIVIALGVPGWIATPISWILYILIGLLIVGVLRGTIIR